MAGLTIPPVATTTATVTPAAADTSASAVTTATTQPASTTPDPVAANEQVYQANQTLNKLGINEYDHAPLIRSTGCRFYITTPVRSVPWFVDLVKSD